MDFNFETQVAETYWFTIEIEFLTTKIHTKMADVPENIKEIIDSAIENALSPIIDKLSQADPQQAKGKEVVEDSDVSDAVKQWIKDKQDNPFIGKPLNETTHVGTTPEQLKNMRTL